MFTFGFSYVGFIYLAMLFIPNLIWTKSRPEGYTSEGENKVLGILEKTGEALCTCCALVFTDFNIRGTEWIIWLGISFVLMVLYEIYWLRYFRSEKKLEDFYQPMFGVKVPGATLPVAAFFLLGIYGTNIFMILSSIILGIGHIGIHLQHYKKLHSEKTKLVAKIAKRVVLVLAGVVFAVLVFFIGARNLNYMNHYRLIAQVVSMDLNNRTMAEDAFNRAEANGGDVALLNKRYEDYLADPCVFTTLPLRQEAFRFLPEALPENSTWIALTSPYMGMGDFKWFLKQLGPLEDYLALNKQLYDSLLEFDLYDVAIPEGIPVCFISGTLDYACPVVTIEEYISRSGVDGSLYTLEECGHNVQYTKPHEVSKIILDVLAGG